MVNLMIVEKKITLIKGMKWHALTSDPHEEYMTKWSRTARRGLFFEDPSYMQSNQKEERTNEQWQLVREPYEKR